MKNNQIRRLAMLGALTLLMQSVTALPAAAADSAAVKFNDGFEAGVSGWEGHGSAKVDISTASPYAGSSALAVTGRSEAWTGAQKDLTGIVSTGETYAFSACAYYESGPQTVSFMLSLTYTGADGKPVYDHIAKADTMAGFYVQMFNASYTVPAEAKDPVLCRFLSF